MPFHSKVQQPVIVCSQPCHVFLGMAAQKAAVHNRTAAFAVC